LLFHLKNCDICCCSCRGAKEWRKELKLMMKAKYQRIKAKKKERQIWPLKTALGLFAKIVDLKNFISFQASINNSINLTIAGKAVPKFVQTAG
jgi:hypothetical protein